MKNQELLISSNEKKGILLEVKGQGLKVSVWKKETPVPIVLDRASAVKICEFISRI